MGRKKLRNPKTRNSYSLEYVEQLGELRDKLSPMGLSMTDSQAIDVIVTTMHRIIFDERLQVFDTDELLRMLNRHFKAEFANRLAHALKDFGHEDVRTEWQPDGSIAVLCGDIKAVVPPQMFAGGLFDKESLLRDAPTPGLSGLRT